MNELDKLRPEVREARTDLYVHGHLMPKLQKSIGILDAELLRLADVETELAVLRARIEGAPSVVLSYAGGHWHDAPYAVMAQARVPDDSWCNRRVRLVEEG